METWALFAAITRVQVSENGPVKVDEYRSTLLIDPKPLKYRVLQVQRGTVALNAVGGKMPVLALEFSFN